MPSDYEEFYVLRRDESGALVAVPGVNVEIYDCDAEADIDTVVTDSNGLVAGDTLASVDVGTRIRFRVENEDGLAGSVTQITT